MENKFKLGLKNSELHSIRKIWLCLYKIFRHEMIYQIIAQGETTTPISFETIVFENVIEYNNFCDGLIQHPASKECW